MMSKIKKTYVLLDIPKGHPVMHALTGGLRPVKYELPVKRICATIDCGAAVIDTTPYGVAKAL